MHVAPFDAKHGIADAPRRLSTRSGHWSKRKDEPSYRKRVEVTSARKTRMHGAVVTSQRAHRLTVLQRVPTETVAKEAQTCRLVGKGLRCPGTLRIQLIEEDRERKFRGA